MSIFQKRIGLSLVLIGIVAIALAVGLNLSNQDASPPQGTLVFSMTLDPTTIANLTSIPQATPLSDEDAEQFLIFVDRVESCEDYSDERRAQMLQHIEWLVDPSSIPTDMLLVLGKTPDSTLIFGMASFTSIQWRILERPAESCLIDIGRDINLLLEGLGGEPFTIYDETN
jgi:hypothetical protein